MADTVKIGRQTIIFYLPNSMDAFVNDQSPNTLSDEGVGWYRAQLYMNPQTINIRDRKLVKSDLTKGGFVTQYWGEDLTKVEVRGTTGSAGIEGISVLRGIYRHEQAQYREILDDRKRRLAEEATDAADRAAGKMASYSDGPGENIANLLTGGAFSETVDGIKNSIDLVVDAFVGNGSSGTTSFRSPPTLAALATNVDMYFQGEFFRGYFEFFNVDENASEPGHFTYSFNFTVLRRTGKRDNFMPWHRNPLDSSGNTQMSKGVTEAKGDPNTGGDNFTFPIADYTGTDGESFSFQSQLQTTDAEAPGVQDDSVDFPQNRPGQG